MSPSRASLPEENPFCTRRTRPGAIPYLLPSGESVATLAARLERCGGWGAIVGPHGSGKSTLLAALIPILQQAGQRTLLVALHDGQRRLPSDLRAVPELRRPAVVIIDGYEQLGRLARCRLKWFCRRRGLGLLVTSHALTGLPCLLETSTNVEQACQIVEQLLGPQQSLIPRADVVARFSRRAGDLREVLMDLYDLYEEARG